MNEVEIKVSADDDTRAGLSSAERQVDGLGDALDRLSRRADDSGRRMAASSGGAERYGRGIEGVGERADEVDTRMMGLSDGITGVNDLMHAGELSAAEMAMAFADIGSSIYNTVAPSVADLRDKLRGVPGAATEAAGGLDEAGGAADRTSGRLGGLGRAAAMAGGAAGLGALAAGIDAFLDSQERADVSQITQEYLAYGDAMAAVEQAQEGFHGGAEKVVGVFEELLRQSPDLAEAFVEQIEAEKGVSSATAEMREQIDTVRAANENATEAADSNAEATRSQADAVRDYSDALNAAFDPVFGMYDALGQNREAQVAVTEAQNALNEAIRVHGAGSTEAAAAEQALTDAQMANAESALGVTSAQNELIASIRDGSTSVSNLRAQMQTWDQQGLLSQGVLQAVAAQLGITTEEALRLGGIDPNVDISAVDRATSPIQNIAANLGWLDGQSAQVTITTLRRNITESISRVNPFSGWGGQAHGGITPAASGGIRNGLTLVGENGPELAKLPPGTHVTPAGSTAAALAGAGGGGGPVFNLYVQGSVISERELLRTVRDKLLSGGFVGAIR